MNELALCKGLRELALFAGAGGGILGGKLLGWRTRCAVEINAGCRRILLARQRDGLLDSFPIWDDVCTFDGNPWRGSIDVISAGIPCQRVSAAGLGGGFLDQPYYHAFRRIVGEVRPKRVLVENSPLLVSRGLGGLLGDLAALGYDARWGVLGADAAGFPHHRARLWLVAYPERGERREKQHDGPSGRVGGGFQSPARNTDWESVIAQFRGDRYGLADRLDRTDAIRNGQVPAVVKLAWETLTQGTPP